MSKTFVIAEAAGCHDGDLDHAQRLVHFGAQAGADAVKFQWCSNPQRLASRRKVFDAAGYGRLAFPLHWHDVLAAECARAGVEYMCTVYLPEDVHVVEPYVKRFKIAALESRDRHFITVHGEWKKPVIVSAAFGDRPSQVVVENSGDRFGTGYVPPQTVSVLLCVAAYPAPLLQVNLHRLRTEPFAGLSDHTAHTLTGAAAVAAGAKIVEFHMRSDLTSTKNPDFVASLSPTSAAEYVANIRTVEKLMGPNPVSAEEPLRPHRVGVAPVDNSTIKTVGSSGWGSIVGDPLDPPAPWPQSGPRRSHD